MSDTYYDLGDHHRPITTTSDAAQLWFDRGSRWCDVFNYEEALSCFETAAQEDPSAAMTQWGIALASGPNYNKAWRLFREADLRESTDRAISAIRRAKELSEEATPVERAMIEALAVRFPDGEIPTRPEDFAALDLRYAEAMRVVYSRHGNDLDIAAHFADALMCVSPRALWDLDTGEPVGYGTLEARDVIEKALAAPDAQDHPVLNHLYIHLMEMSPHPEVALPAADRLRRMAPDASHTTHMSTHIDAACGDWRRVVASNLDAADADDRYFARATPRAWASVYRVHNLMVGAYGGMMSGNSREALRAAHRLESVITPELLRSDPSLPDLVESHRTTLPHVLVRFGRWEEILAMELPADQELFCSTTAMIHYAKGVALSALGRLAEADVAREDFRTAAARVPETRLNSVPSREVDALAVASSMLDGELQYRQGDVDDAFASLEEAIRLEDALPYSDPPSWLQPVRHAYGALLTEQGRLDEAVAVYRADLYLDRTLGRRRTRPNNVWSLHGLHECLTRLDRVAEANEVGLQRDVAVASADVRIAASCFCRLSAVDDSGGPPVAVHA